MDDIYDYLKANWYGEELSDFEMALDSGFILLAASILDSAGAISPEFSYNPEMERAIVKALKKYTKKQKKLDLDDCFGDAVVYVNKQTCQHYFVKNKYVDYLIDASEAKRWGWITSEDYYKEVLA